MGNSAAKQLDETELGVGTIKSDDGRAVTKALVTTSDGTTKIKNKSKTWVQYGGGDDSGTLLWRSQSVGLFKKHSVIFDSAENPIAVIITEKKGMASCTNYICRKVASFDGQEPLTDEELANAGVKGDGDEKVVIYKFSKIECSRSLTTATCKYGLVTGTDEIKALYEGEKLSSLGFKAIFKEIPAEGESIVVAKAFMPGMSMSPHVDAAVGVDMLALVSIGYALAGDESSAGALAGAGVI
jgi:hypothetical protein